MLCSSPVQSTQVLRVLAVLMPDMGVRGESRENEGKRKRKVERRVGGKEERRKGGRVYVGFYIIPSKTQVEC